MIKKIIAIALSALLFTACHAEEREEQVTGTAETTVTTQLTLTEIITEENFLEPENDGIIDLAVYNPFTDIVDIDDAARQELTDAMKKILDGYAFFTSSIHTDRFYIGSEYENNFAATDIAMETDTRNGYVYSPLNPEIAETEEELIEYFRSVFSEKWLGENYEENIRETIFNEGLQGYKTIDGTLCVLVSPDSGRKRRDLEKMVILDYDGTTAKIVTESPPYAGAPANVRHFSNWIITKYDDYGWRLDTGGGFDYDEMRTNMVYTLMLNRDKINDVLSGNTAKETIVVIDGEEYFRSEIDMSIEEMTDFFTDIFHEKSLASADNLADGEAGGKLRERYINKYITEVYIEKDGTLYRRASAPEWYLPEMKLVIGNVFAKDEYASSFTTHILIDEEDYPITVKYGIEVGGVRPLCFASDLPIKEITE